MDVLTEEEYIAKIGSEPLSMEEFLYLADLSDGYHHAAAKLIEVFDTRMEQVWAHYAAVNSIAYKEIKVWDVVGSNITYVVDGTAYGLPVVYALMNKEQRLTLMRNRKEKMMNRHQG